MGEINKDLQRVGSLAMQPGLEGEGISLERQIQLAGISNKMLDVFSESKDLGTTQGPPSPTAWPWVRYLVYDRLKERWGHGKSVYKDTKWNKGDKFIRDLSELAERVSQQVPENVTATEWQFLSLGSISLIKRRITKEQAAELDMDILLRGPGDGNIRQSLDRWAGIIDVKPGAKSGKPNKDAAAETPKPNLINLLGEARNHPERDISIELLQADAALRFANALEIPVGYKLHLIDTTRIRGLMNREIYLGIAPVGDLPDGVQSIRDLDKCVQIIPSVNPQGILEDYVIPVRYGQEIPQEIYIALGNALGKLGFDDKPSGTNPQKPH